MVVRVLQAGPDGELVSRGTATAQSFLIVGRTRPVLVPPQASFLHLTDAVVRPPRRQARLLAGQPPAPPGGHRALSGTVCSVHLHDGRVEIVNESHSLVLRLYGLSVLPRRAGRGRGAVPLPTRGEGAPPGPLDFSEPDWCDLGTIAPWGNARRPDSRPLRESFARLDIHGAQVHSLYLDASAVPTRIPHTAAGQTYDPLGVLLEWPSAYDDDVPLWKRFARTPKDDPYRALLLLVALVAPLVRNQRTLRMLKVLRHAPADPARWPQVDPKVLDAALHLVDKGETGVPVVKALLATTSARPLTPLLALLYEDEELRPWITEFAREGSRETYREHFRDLPQRTAGGAGAGTASALAAVTAHSRVGTVPVDAVFTEQGVLSGEADVFPLRAVHAGRPGHSADCGIDR